MAWYGKGFNDGLEESSHDNNKNSWYDGKTSKDSNKHLKGLRKNLSEREFREEVMVDLVGENRVEMTAQKISKKYFTDDSTFQHQLELDILRLLERHLTTSNLVNCPDCKAELEVKDGKLTFIRHHS